MIKLDVLAIGRLVRDENGSITDVYSSSVLISSDDMLTVVDTSSRSMRPAVQKSFRQIGVLPTDVNTVVLTHSHSDHTENLSMFPNADIIIHSGEEREIEGSRVIDEDMVLSEGVKLVHTPGHTMGSMSVFVDADKRYVISGDAVPLRANLDRMIPPAINCDPDLALKSIKMIGKYADMVVPGHDFPFMTQR